MVKNKKQKFEREVVQIILTGPDFTNFMKTVENSGCITSWISEWGVAILAPALVQFKKEKIRHLIYIHEAEPSVMDTDKRWKLIDRTLSRVKDPNNMKHLPKNFYFFDRNKAIETYTEGVKTYGLGWYSDGGADRFRYSNVIQMALFGEVVYA